MTRGDARRSSRTWGRRLPSEPAAAPVRRVALLSVHTSPLAQAGVGDSGGMNVSLLSLARRMAARGVAVDIFTRAAGVDLPAAVTVADGATVHHLQAGPPAVPKEELASYLCAFTLGLVGHPAFAAAEVLHGHYWMSGWVGRHAARRLGLPFVQSFHTLGRVKNAALAPGERPEPALRLAAEDRIIAGADRVLAASPAEVAALRDHYGAAPGRVELVPPGVDLEVFTADGDRRAARQALGGGRIVLFVGRLQPLKAPDLAVRALAALDRFLPADGVPARLVVVGGPSGRPGEGGDPAALGRLAQHLGVADRVAFLAPRPQRELAPLYRAADAVVVPSHSESFGLVALEAQACGTPVVAADVGGLRTVVGRGGTLVDSRDPLAFAAALAPFLVDPALRDAAGRAGRRDAERFSWGRSVAATLDVYAAVVTAATGVGAVSQRGA